MLTKSRIIPTHPGVYVFWLKRAPLYIGKAANLKKRLASYFQKLDSLPVKIQRMLEEATRLEIIKTASEIEALLKEAELIKKYRPKYNLLMRDDKSYFYVAVTKEEYPRIFITHQPKYYLRDRENSTRGTRTRSRITAASALRHIGPFTNGTALYTTLKLLRRVFPYCTCKRPHKRPCLNAEIGRCPGYCCAAIAASSFQLPAASRQRNEYRRNTRNIVAVLEGRKMRLVGGLKKQINEAVRRERFEEAAKLRDQIFGLEDVFQHRPVLQAPEMRYAWPEMLAKLQALLKTSRAINRIEGYDISNIAGTEATGSMVVFINGQPDKSQYRKFRIRMPAPPGGGSDTDMLKEVLRRRLGHPEWPYPELMVIDGGKGQLNAARSVLYYSHDRENNTTKSELHRPIAVALAKREEILFTESNRVIPLQRQDPALLHLFQRIRDESHRFARKYHHKLRQRRYAQS